MKHNPYRHLYSDKQNCVVNALDLFIVAFAVCVIVAIGMGWLV